MINNFQLSVREFIISVQNFDLIYHHHKFGQNNSRIIMYKSLLGLKNILIRFLGKKNYLRFISRSYFILEGFNLLKFFGQELQDVFHLNKFVKAGYTCIDIGANLGYYTVPLSKLAGDEGRVIAVEPVPMFVEVLKSNLNALARNNVFVHNVALGENDGETLVMGTPVIDGIYRHGFTKVVEDDGFEYTEKYEVAVKNPAKLFSDIREIHFLKCDVEGYEHHIIPLMYDIIKKFKPVILIEFGSPDNKKMITKEFLTFGYEAFSVTKTRLLKVDDPVESASETNNFFFIYNLNQNHIGG